LIFLPQDYPIKAGNDEKDEFIEMPGIYETGDMIYRHRQTGFVMIVLFVIAFFICVDLFVLGIVFWFHLLSATMLGLIIVLMVLIPVPGVLFSALTITINQRCLDWYFAFGFWKKNLKIADISSCRIVKNPWYYGWGIRRIPGGWLYSVSGRKAVEIRLRDDGLLRLGSDEPDKLLAALKKAKVV